VALQIVTMAARPELDPLSASMPDTWPEFMRWDHVAAFYFNALENWSEFVLFAVDDGAPDVVLAKAYSIPFVMSLDDRRQALPPDGWDRVITWGWLDHRAGRTPNMVSAIEIALHPDHQGRGLSGQMVMAMRDNAARLGFADLVAPVRPNRKHREPTAPMSEYAFRTRADGLPADDWLRVHVRVGGVIEQIAPNSMTISGTLEQWRGWTGLPFDESGAVIVPGALVPVHVDLDHDVAVYVEPNVWIRHRTGAG
jgi:GNAT superfamily N-acetyltransferase